jgi:predicted RNase H-like HicB family nuclease
MAFKIEIDREEDGRWIAEIPNLPGVMAYGKNRNEAIARVEALALRVLADRRGPRPRIARRTHGKFREEICRGYQRTEPGPRLQDHLGELAV